MDKQEMYSHIDHTALKAYATIDDIDKLCQEAISHKMASVCIPSSYISHVFSKYQGKLRICTVIGFPLGNASTVAKIEEARTAILDGADEIDVVINIGRVKSGDYNYIHEELSQLRGISKNKILKVIVETCYLTEEELIRLCEIVTEIKADYIKTSTGFGSGGARLDDVRIMRKHIGHSVKIKASGGIRTKEELESYISEGCDRIGTSSAISMLED